MIMTARDFWTRYRSAGGRAVLKGTRSLPERWLICLPSSTPGDDGTLYLCAESRRCVPTVVSDTAPVIPGGRGPRQPHRTRRQHA
jgi:hypothetical protein